MNQKTIKHTISCVGKGIHTGKVTSLSLYPAPANFGILFVRTDVKHENNKVNAKYDAVSKTRLGTTIQNSSLVEVATVEHLMAALWGSNIDNVIIELDGPEVPVMDGSSEQFMYMIECAGTEVQDEKRKFIEILKEIRVTDKDSFAVLHPADHFSIDAEIVFDNSCINSQKYKFSDRDSFKNDLAKARTFGFKKDADMLRKNGLALGASLDNAVVISGSKILNKGGLFYTNEFVRHKVLDVIGDFYLAGNPIRASVQTFKPGHTLNNKVLHTIFSDETAWRIVS